MSVIEGLKGELPLYISAALGAEFDTSDVGNYSEQVLAWWRQHAPSLPKWSAAARVRPGCVCNQPKLSLL